MPLTAMKSRPITPPSNIKNWTAVATASTLVVTPKTNAARRWRSSWPPAAGPIVEDEFPAGKMKKK